MVDINADAVLVSIIVDATLFNPNQRLTPSASRNRGVDLNHSANARFDLCVLLAGIVLLVSGNKSSIHYLDI